MEPRPRGVPYSKLLLLLFQTLPPLGASLSASLSRRSALANAAASSLLAPAAAAANIAIARGQPPPVALRDGALMPASGDGTCCRKSANGPALVASAKEYLGQGGRLLDTAQLYDNHDALATAMRESGVPRSQIWITDKLNTAGGEGRVSTRAGALASVRASARELGTDYVDLMLIHGVWGIDAAEQVDVWRGLLDARARGLARTVGVSNFGVAELARLEDATGVLPLVNQIEFHPWVPDATRDLARWCQARGVAITAYSSLRGARKRARADAVQRVAAAPADAGVTDAQVLLRWALRQGVAVIPGATSPEHIRENLYLPDFDLTESDLAVLRGSEAPPALAQGGASGEVA